MFLKDNPSAAEVANEAAQDAALAANAAADVAGPAVAVDNAIPVYDGTSGKTIKAHLAAQAVTIDPATGSVTVPALATVDGVDVSVHAAATASVHGSDAGGKYPSTPALAGADAAGAATAAVDAHKDLDTGVHGADASTLATAANIDTHAALTTHLSADERAGVDGALGGALTALNPAIGKAARRVYVVCSWDSGTAAYQRAAAAYGPTLTTRCGFSKAELDFTNYDYKMRIHGGSANPNGAKLYTWDGGASAAVDSSEILNLTASNTGTSGIITAAQIAAGTIMVTCEIKGDGGVAHNLYHYAIIGVPK